MTFHRIASEVPELHFLDSECFCIGLAVVFSECSIKKPEQLWSLLWCLVGQIYWSFGTQQRWTFSKPFKNTLALSPILHCSCAIKTSNYSFWKRALHVSFESISGINADPAFALIILYFEAGLPPLVDTKCRFQYFTARIWYYLFLKSFSWKISSEAIMTPLT